MKQSFTDLLLSILSIMRYKDKEKFVKEFEETNHLEAMTNCLEELAQSAQEDVAAHLCDPSVVRKYVSQDSYMREITAVSAKALVEFIAYMVPVLSYKQREQINELIVSHQSVQSFI